MKKFIYTILCSLVLLSLSTANAKSSVDGSAMLQKLDKKKSKITLENALKGKPTIVEFLASWCGSCGESMDMIGKVQKAKKYNFVPISLDEEYSMAYEYFGNVNKFRKTLKKISYFDTDQKMAEMFSVPRLPATYIVDSSGKIVKSYDGKVDKKKMKKILADLAKVK